MVMAFSRGVLAYGLSRLGDVQRSLASSAVRVEGGRRSTIVGLPPCAVPNFAKSLIVVALVMRTSNDRRTSPAEQLDRDHLAGGRVEDRGLLAGHFAKRSSSLDGDATASDVSFLVAAGCGFTGASGRVSCA